MSDLLLVGLGAVVLVTNGYWWRRVRTTNEALARSVDRDERVSDRVEADPENAATLQEAATRADCPPDELPERIEALRDRIREREGELQRVQQAWARSWWTALSREAVDLDEPHALCITLPGATTDDIQRFADHAQQYEREVAIVLAPEEGTVAVSVGTALTDVVSATEVLGDITDEAGGNGGGSETFATGGGADTKQLAGAATAAKEEVAARLAGRE